MASYSNFKVKLEAVIENAGYKNNIYTHGSDFEPPCILYDIYNVKSSLFGAGEGKTAKANVQLDVYSNSESEVLEITEKFKLSCNNTKEINGFVIDSVFWDEQCRYHRAILKFNINL